MTERTTVRLPEDLLRRAKRRAAAERRTLTSLIEHGLRLALDEKRQPEKRVIPIVSSAKGGPLPGIDLDDMSTIQEMEDMDYAVRLSRLR
jgi:hypothetical protein